MHRVLHLIRPVMIVRDRRQAMSDSSSYDRSQHKMLFAITIQLIVVENGSFFSVEEMQESRLLG